MRPMSLYESLDSTGEVSLKALFETPEQIKGENSLDLNQLAFLVCRGGWPRATDLKGETALEQAFDYYDAVVKSDISRADGITRNPERVKRLMRSYARNQGSQATNTLLKDDIMANDVEFFDTDTIYSYINALQKIFVIEEMEAWIPNLRSKAAIRTSNTRYFVVVGKILKNIGKLLKITDFYLLLMLILWVSRVNFLSRFIKVFTLIKILSVSILKSMILF